MLGDDSASKVDSGRRRPGDNKASDEACAYHFDYDLLRGEGGSVGDRQVVLQAKAAFRNETHQALIVLAMACSKLLDVCRFRVRVCLRLDAASWSVSLYVDLDQAERLGAA